MFFLHTKHLNYTRETPQKKEWQLMYLNINTFYFIKFYIFFGKTFFKSKCPHQENIFLFSTRVGDEIMSMWKLLSKLGLRRYITIIVVMLLSVKRQCQESRILTFLASKQGWCWILIKIHENKIKNIIFTC